MEVQETWAALRQAIADENQSLLDWWIGREGSELDQICMAIKSIDSATWFRLALHRLSQIGDHLDDAVMKEADEQLDYWLRMLEEWRLGMQGLLAKADQIMD